MSSDRAGTSANVALARLDRLDDYVAAGVDRVVVMLPTGVERQSLKEVAEVANGG